MKRFRFNIVRRLRDGGLDDQNVWTTARNIDEARDYILHEYWGVEQITLISVDEIKD